MKKKIRVCIPTAGIGSRIEKISNSLNKSLIPINNKAVISHIIDCFPLNYEFVIPLGYKGKLVQQYLKLAHPTHKFFFIDIKKYKGEGSGLGLTLIKSKKYLQCPFIFISCDTLIKGKINYLPDHNWVGYSEGRLSNQYRKIELDNNNNLKKFLNKNSKKKKNYKNYIGLAGIYDFKEFWKNNENKKNISISQGEVLGINLIKKNIIKSYKFNWYDIGNEKSYYATQKILQNNRENPNILEKKKECIWFNNNIAIKYFENHNIINKRVIRSNYIKNFIPKILKKENNMYSYSKFNGKVFSKIEDISIFKSLLNHIKKFHRPIKKFKNSKIFFKQCEKFYKYKTYQRLFVFYEKFKIKDNDYQINNSKRITLGKLLKKINWSQISKGLAGRFHGDLHFENIVYSQKKKKFCFLDWRHDFSGSLTVGDIYYDLAKMLHGLLVSHESIVRENYFVEIKRSKVKIHIKNKKIYQKYIKVYYDWLKKNKYDIKKVNILTGLIFLNICALHHFPYSVFLYYMGKEILIKEIKN